jgi:SAM-dependent methyltransferase
VSADGAAAHGASVIDPARSFDRAAIEYERARPGYPAGVLDVLPLGPEIEALDLGAGTGKLTRVLAGRYRRVLAVEPLDGMRAILDEVVPAAESLAGSAEAIPLADASVDAVFAAQAFHWFSNDDAVAEIARVLRPGGVLCLIWNESAAPSPLPEAYRSYLRTLHLPKTDVAGHPWAEVVARGPFGEIHDAAVPHEQVQDRAAVLAFARSVSWIAHRADDERERIMRDLDELLPPGPFAFSMSAGVNWAVRT